MATTPPGTSWFDEAGGLYRTGDLPGAAALLHRGVAVEPRHPRASFLLGMIAMQSGRPAEAGNHFDAAAAADPAFAEPHFLHGLVCQQGGRHAEAVEHYRRAAAIDPRHFKAMNNLGRALIDDGRAPEGVAVLRKLAGLDPGNVSALINLGDGLRLAGETEAAIDACRRAVAVDPKRAEAHGNLAAALARAGRYTEAVDGFNRAISVNPKLASAHYNLGKILLQGMQPDAALERALTAVQLRPNYADAHTLVGELYGLAGRLPEALAAQQRAASVSASPPVHGNLLMTLNYLPDLDPAAVKKAHADWAARHTPACTVAPPPGARPPGRLRIGYVSPNFTSHSVAYFFRPVLEAHDRTRFEIFLYAEVRKPDAMTTRLRALADQWRDVTGWKPAAVADLIRADRIDVLVDLAGHTGDNLLPVFALRPAPVAMTWLGYPATTGMTAIDYRITDEMADPPGSESHYVEKLIRMPGSCWTYGPPADAPAVSPAPAASNGFVTFGSFNNLPKVTPVVLETWGRIMNQVPGSRLVLKALGLSGKLGRDHILSSLGRSGVSSDRVDLLGWATSTASHLDLYGRVDLALDPFPYNGTTTTCEALWMGVPVVTFTGRSHAGRVGASLLTHAGLPQYVAADVGDYVRLAVELASDVDGLVRERFRLRDRFAASSVCDGPRLAKHLEAVFASHLA
jgi:protein O-GlcNAc transferase